MPGFFFISSACFLRSSNVPSTISCITWPLLTGSKRTISPCLTVICAGVNRIWSDISTLTTRLAFVASAGRPNDVSFGRPWPPWSWAKATGANMNAAINQRFIRFPRSTRQVIQDWTVGAVIAVAISREVLERLHHRLELCDLYAQVGDVLSGDLLHRGAGA